MNKQQLLSKLNQTWEKGAKARSVFLIDKSGEETAAKDFIQALENPSLELLSYTHPQLNQPLALIQQSTAREILFQLFNAWGKGHTPLILDPALSARRTQESLDEWGLKKNPSSHHFDNQNNLAMAMATSGSSGTAKLIGLGVEQLAESCSMARDFYAESFPHSWGLTLPCWHIGGFMVLWRMFMTGGQVYELDLKSGPDSLPWGKVQALSLVPTQLQRLLNQNQGAVLAKLSLILIGGAACPPELIERAKKDQLPISLSYGATETSSLVAALTPHQEQDPHSLHPLPGVRFRIGADKKLQISSPTLHIWRIEDQQLKNKRPGEFYQTQDLARLGPTGELDVQGRADLTFISGGENINITKIEKTALEFPYIEQVVLLHRKDPEFGQVGHLYYQPSQTQKVDFEHEFMQYLRSRLRPFERPKSLELMPSYNSLKPPRAEWQKQIEQKAHHFKEAPNFLLLHGFMGLPDEYFDMKQALIQKGWPAWKIKALRLPGHDSQKLTSFAELIDREIKSPHVFYAYSMGARILSMWLHHSLPQETKNLKALILESAHPGGLSPESARARLQQDAQIFDSKKVDLREFLQKWGQLPLFEGLDKAPRAQELIQIKAKRHQPDQLYQALQRYSVAHQPDVSLTWHKLAETRPVLYLSGTKDTKYTEVARQLTPNSKIQHRQHPWSSHNIHVLDPEWCAQQLVSLVTHTKGSSI